MFCIQCGKPLPNGAKFCAFCGKPQSVPSLPDSMDDLFAGLPDAASSDLEDLFPKTVPPAGSLPENHAAGPASQKSGKLVCVPGNGVYICFQENLFFLPDGGKKVKKLTRNRGNHRYFAMDYFRGEIYQWRLDENGYCLTALDVYSGDKRKITFPEKIDPILYKSRFQIQNGVAYCLLSGNKFLEINLTNGLSVVKNLPDIRTKPLPKDWMECGRFNTFARHPNYGEPYSFLYVSGDFGYASFLGSEFTAVRFLLKDPSQFSFVPESRCCVPLSHNGIISVCGPWLAGSGRQEGKISLTRFGPDGSTEKYITADLGLVGPQGFDGWWKVGNQYVVLDRLLNLDTMKIRRLPFTLKADDFAETSSGVYVLSSDLRALYCLPRDFGQVVKSEDDLGRYMIAKLD